MELVHRLQEARMEVFHVPNGDEGLLAKRLEGGEGHSGERIVFLIPVRYIIMRL